MLGFRRDYGPQSAPALRLSAAGFGGVKYYPRNPVGAWFNDLGQCIPFLHLAGGQDSNSQAVRDYLSGFPTEGLFTLGTGSAQPPTTPGTNPTGSSGGGTTMTGQKATILPVPAYGPTCNGKPCFGYRRSTVGG